MLRVNLQVELIPHIIGIRAKILEHFYLMLKLFKYEKISQASGYIGI